MQKIELFEKKVEIIIPLLFKEMNKEDIQKRFARGTPPNIVYADEKGSPSISISLKENPITQETISKFVDLIEKSITGPLPQTKTVEKGTKEINGRKVGYIAIITPSTNGDIYNYMFFTDFNKNLLLFNFSCMNRSFEEWNNTISSINSSLKIN